MKTKPWEKFERDCTKHLNSLFKDIKFVGSGGHNSNSSDIQVFKDKNLLCSIECKMNLAQCGQFVLFVDEENKKFIFSKKNKTPFDKYVKAIIDEMERHFSICVSSTKELPISENTIIKWVKNYYLNVKNSKYWISHDRLGNFIIIPTKNIDKYFSFSAKYRKKISGSTDPSKNNIAELTELLKHHKINSTIEFENSKCFTKYNCNKEEFILQGSKYRYQFKKVGNKYNIRRLSNTSNYNFIVSIKLEHPRQIDTDYKDFEQFLLK